MTDPDQQTAADRAARELERRLRPYVPEISRWDLARQFVADLQAEHWRCLPPPPDHLRPHAPPQEAAAAARRGAQLARQALTQPQEDHRA